MTHDHSYFRWLPLLHRAGSGDCYRYCRRFCSAHLYRNSQIQDLGDFGDAAEDVSFAVVNDDRLHYRKGSMDGGVMPLILSYDGDDAGQAALKVASASRLNYAFKIELGGIAGEPPAEEVVLLPGPGLRHRTDVGGPDRVLSVNSEIAINSALVTAWCR